MPKPALVVQVRPGNEANWDAIWKWLTTPGKENADPSVATTEDGDTSAESFPTKGDPANAIQFYSG